MTLEKRKIILIIGSALSQNHGSEAMTIASSEILLNNIKNSKIIIASIRKSDEKRIINKNIQIIHEINNRYILIKRILEIGIFKLFKIPPKDKILSMIYQSNLVIDLSGDTISDIYPYYLRNTFWRYLAIFSFKKPLVFFPQTMGPFNRIDIRLLAYFVLNKSKLIFAREKITYNFLKKFLKNSSKVKFCIDSAFFLEKSENDVFVEKLKTNKKKVGISVSEYLTKYPNIKDKNLYKKYLDIMTQLIDFIIDSYSCIVFLVPHVVGAPNDDRIIQNKIFNQLNENSKKFCINITADLDAKKLKNLISNLDLFIGSRMHANIAAISSNVPTIAIAYSHKFHGIMSLFDLTQFVIMIQNLDLDILKTKFVMTFENLDRIKKILQKTNLKLKNMYKNEIIKNIINLLNN